MKHLLSQIRGLLREEPALVAVLGVGLLFRITGLFSDIPFPDPLQSSFHPDEAIIITGAVEFPRHILTNNNFVYPTFFAYALGILTLPLRPLFAVLDLSGETFTHVVTVIGRLGSVLAGTGAILLTYVFARELYDKRRALLASIFLCLALYHAHNSSFLTPDVLTSFLLLLVVFLLRRAFLRSYDTFMFVLTGMVFGLLIGTKYPGGIVVVAVGILYAHALIRPGLGDAGRPRVSMGKLTANVFVCGGVAAVTFLATNPGIILHLGDFMSTIVGLQAEAETRTVQAQTVTAPWDHIRRTLNWTVGFPMAGLFLFGIVFPYKKTIYEISIIALVLAYFWYFGTALFARYVIMVIPLMAIIASNGAFWIYDRPGRPFRILGATVTGVVVAYSLGNCVNGVYWRLNDTRTQAAGFIDANLPPGTTFGMAYTRVNEPWHYLRWAYPKIDTVRFRYQDFLEYPMIVVRTSWQAIDREESPKLRQRLEELQDPDRGRYQLWATFKKQRPFPRWNKKARIFSRPEFASPEISIFARRYYGPYTTSKSYYEDNPRGYFDEADPREWLSLSFAYMFDAHLVLPAGAEIVRIVNDELPKDTTPWGIRLVQSGLSVQSNQQYTLTFRARADEPRLVPVGLGPMSPPWDTLGLYQEFEFTSAWKKFEESFVATADEENAGVWFGLAGDTGSVELADITLTRLSDNTTVEPDFPKYSVQYRFNESGCRDDDYPIPRRKDTMRILVLGDSYALGAGVHEPDTFASQLEWLLNERAAARSANTTYEVINCGVAGYGTRDARLFYESVGAKYQPDVVLLTMVPGDDRSWLDDIAMGRTSHLDEFDYQFALRPAAQEGPSASRLPDFAKMVQEILVLHGEIEARGARLNVVVFRNTRHQAWVHLVSEVSEGLRHTTIPVHDLGSALFEDRREQDLIVNSTDPRPNEIAHRLAARQILRFLDAQGVLEIQ